MITISVVSPVYTSESLVPALVEQLRQELEMITTSYEIILVDDRSPDRSWAEIKRVCAQYPEVIGLRLSRNFGQHYAISAGLNKTKGEWVVVIDCDLQDLPSEISKLYAEAQKGHDIVLARRAIRKDNYLKKLSSKLFYLTLSYLTGIKHDPAIANFGIYKRKVIEAINNMPETIRYFPTMVRWVGFNVSTVDVLHAERPEGNTSYNFRKLMNLALDICLVNSDKPLRLVVKAGFMVSIVGFIIALYVVFRALRGEIIVMGYASLFASIWMLSGFIVLITGIVGLYVGKVFEGVKRRPAFLVDEVLENE